MTMTVEEYVINLAAARRAVSETEEIINSAETALERTPEYRALMFARQRAEECKHIMQMADLALRDAALANFDGTHKALHPAVGIRLTVDVDVDESEAKPWIRHNAPTYLIETISKDFTRAIRAGLLPANIPGVVVSRDVPQVSISQDLSAWLPNAERAEPAPGRYDSILADLTAKNDGE